MPDGDEDRACDRDERFELAAAFDQSPVAFSGEGVGAGSRCSGLAEPLVSPTHVFEEWNQPTGLTLLVAALPLALMWHVRPTARG